MRGSRLALAVALVALTGCARFRPEPLYIQFPDPPHLTYRLCDAAAPATSDVCLSQADAAALAKWFDKVRAFEHARERLLR